jgi:uncharacterized protein YifN (PemK superfamily)
MKKIFIILFIWPIVFFGQLADTCFTTEEILDISETLDSLYYLDSINNEIISQQETVIFDLETVIKLDSIEMLYTNKKIELLDNNIQLYIQREKYLKPKWYDHKIIWFTSGIVTAVMTGKMIVEVVQ